MVYGKPNFRIDKKVNEMTANHHFQSGTLRISWELRIEPASPRFVPDTCFFIQIYHYRFQLTE